MVRRSARRGFLGSARRGHRRLRLCGRRSNQLLVLPRRKQRRCSAFHSDLRRRQDNRHPRHRLRGESLTLVGRSGNINNRSWNDHDSASASVPGTTAETPPADSEPPPTTLPAIPEASLSQLQVRVLNGSGVLGAAGRLSDALQDSGYILLPAGNAPRRFWASVVHYVADAHMDEAEQVAGSVEQDSDVGAAKLLASREIQPGDANVIVLIGSDSVGAALREEQAAEGLRPSPRGDVALPLPDDTPRDRFVPGLADIQIFSQINDNSDIGEVLRAMADLPGWLNAAGRYSPLASGQIFAAREKCDWSPRIVDGERQTADDPRFCTLMDREYLETQMWPNIERTLAYSGFTPQNV